jgi:ADP-ribose pyrophosphatase
MTRDRETTDRDDDRERQRDRSWETLTQRVAYECPGFKIVSETVRLPEGTETDFDYLSESPSVVVVPFLAGESDAVVTIEEWREAVGRLNHGLPAGGVEPDESLTEAAHRELREETGHTAEAVEHLVSVEPANGYADSVFHYMLAHGCEPTAEQRLDDDETITVGTTGIDQLLAAIRDGELRDGRTAFALTYYALFESDRF